MIPKALDYFEKIYLHRSLNKACVELGISQPALSKSLKALELEVGAPLFIRRSWGLEPTKFGQAFRAHSLAISKQYQSLERDVHALLNAQLGSVQIGANLGAATQLIPESILALATIRPGIRMSLLEGLYEDLVGGVISGSLDMAVTTATTLELPTVLISEPLFEDPFVIAMAKTHPLSQFVLEGNGDVLLGYPWVLPPDQGILRPRVVELFSRLDARAPVPRVETVSFAALLELMCSGHYLTMQPLSVLKSRLASPHLTWIDDPALTIARTITCIRHRSRELSPAADEFHDVLKNTAQKMRGRNRR